MLKLDVIYGHSIVTTTAKSSSCGKVLICGAKLSRIFLTKHHRIMSYATEPILDKFSIHHIPVAEIV